MYDSKGLDGCTFYTANNTSVVECDVDMMSGPYLIEEGFDDVYEEWSTYERFSLDDLSSHHCIFFFSLH